MENRFLSNLEKQSIFSITFADLINGSILGVTPIALTIKSQPNIFPFVNST